MTEVPNSAAKYEPTDADGVAPSVGKRSDRWRRLVAPRFNEAGPGGAERATTEGPNSGPTHEPTCARREALNERAQRQKGQPVARRFDKAGPGDADRATTAVPNSGPTDAERAALKKQPQRQEEQPPVSRLNEAGPGDADRAITEAPNSEPEIEQTEAERVVVDRQMQRRKELPPAPRINVVEDYRGVRTELDHPDSVVADLLFNDALGTADDDFRRGLLAQLGGFDTLANSAAVETELNFFLSVIKSGKPKEELETMLLSLIGKSFQMSMRIPENFGSIQRDVLKMRRDMADNDPFVLREIAAIMKNLPVLQESTVRSFNRSARMCADLVEAFDRHRRSGEPSTTVHVAPGGQAIVGNVTHANPQTAPNNAAAAPRALTDQQQSAMPIIGESDRVPVPVRRRKNNDQQPSA